MTLGTFVETCAKGASGSLIFSDQRKNLLVRISENFAVGVEKIASKVASRKPEFTWKTKTVKKSWAVELNAKKFKNRLLALEVDTGDILASAEDF